MKEPRGDEEVLSASLPTHSVDSQERAGARHVRRGSVAVMTIDILCGLPEFSRTGWKTNKNQGLLFLGLSLPWCHSPIMKTCVRRLTSSG